MLDKLKSYVNSNFATTRKSFKEYYFPNTRIYLNAYLQRLMSVFSLLRGFD